MAPSSREDKPGPEHSHYLHILDEFRREYEHKTGESTSIPVEGKATLTLPTWEYVCWLEQRLYEVTNIVPIVTTKLSTTKVNTTVSITLTKE